MEFLRKLLETPGLSGREERVREVIKAEIGDLFDEVTTDPMGNLLCVRNPRPSPAGGKAKVKSLAKPLTVLLACHLDEIGFYVRFVEEKTGFLRVHNVGGFDTRTLLARRVLVQTASGDMFGILNGARPAHVLTDEERKKIPEISDLYVDMLTDPKEVAKRVRIGDPVTLVQPLEEIGDSYVSKAIDNRLACWVAIKAVRKLAAGPHNCRVVFVGTVQEEVGCRGALPATFAIKPDVGIALDLTIAADTPGVADDRRVTVWGGGVALKVMDSNSISNRGLIDELLAIAKKKKIKHQLEILPFGGTDAGSVQRSAGGCKAGTISIPTRYCHTTTEAANKHDVAAAIDLLAAYLQQA